MLKKDIRIIIFFSEEEEKPYISLLFNYSP